MEQVTVEQAMDARIAELEHEMKECERRIEILKEEKKELRREIRQKKKARADFAGQTKRKLVVAQDPQTPAA